MRELSRGECLRLLESHGFGRLAVRLGDGPPVIRPVNYVFDGSTHSVVFRSDPGSKLHGLLHAASAAFEIDGLDEGSRTGWSVIVRGLTEEITSPGELRRLERRGVASWAPGPKAHWIRIRTGTVTGRRIVLSGDRVPGRYLG